MTRAAGATAIVLAGGRSMRFGGPKLLVEVEGRPLLAWAVSAVGAVTTEVIVAGAPTPETLLSSARGVAIRSVPDARAFEGPLAGLANALRGTKTGVAIVVGGDMPGLVPAVLRAMLDRLAADEAIDGVLLAGPAGSVRRQVLPLAIDVARASVASTEALAAGDRSLLRFLERLRVIEIPAAEWSPLDPAGRTLLDVDRPEDLAQIVDDLQSPPFGRTR